MGSLALPAGELDARYARILATCEPFVISYPGNWAALDLAPFGYEIGPERCFDPTRLRSRHVIDGLHYLDAATFGDQEMLMPRWVLFDCGEFPGIVCGFGRRARDLDSQLREFYHVADAASSEVFVPLSMWVALRCVQEGAWFGHNLSSVNIIAETPLPGMATLTKCFGIRIARARLQYGATQWASSSLNIHVSLGDLQVLNAFTPAHTHPETFTYCIAVSEDRLVSPLYRDWTPVRAGGERFLDADDSCAIRSLHDEIEAGASFQLVRVERRAEAAQRLWLEPIESPGH